MAEYSAREFKSQIESIQECRRIAVAGITFVANDGCVEVTYNADTVYTGILNRIFVIRTTTQESHAICHVKWLDRDTDNFFHVDKYTST